MRLYYSLYRTSAFARVEGQCSGTGMLIRSSHTCSTCSYLVRLQRLKEKIRSQWFAGVALKSGEQVSADLVVDASGRGTHTPQWLRQAGVPGVAEQEVISSGITYASRRYKRPADWPQVRCPAPSSWIQLFQCTQSSAASLCLADG